MTGGNTALAAPVEDRVAGDEPAVLEDVDLRRGQLHLHRAPADAVGHGVEVAADRDHALAGDATLQGQHGVERADRQRSQRAPLLGEVLEHDAACRAMQPAVGDLVEPLAELQVEVVEVAEAAGQEEVLAHVAERPLDSSLGLGPVGAAGPGHGAVVGGEIQQLVVVDDAALVDLAEHGVFHSIIEDLLRHTAERLERGDVAAQHGSQILPGDEAAPHHAAMAEHQVEQPDDALRPGLVDEGQPEEGEVGLGLPPRGVSKRRSKRAGSVAGLTSRKNSVTVE